MLIQWDTVDNKNQPVKEFQNETQVWLEDMIIATLPSWPFSSDDDRTGFTAHPGLDTGLFSCSSWYCSFWEKKYGIFLVLTSRIIYGRKLNISVFASQDTEQWNHPAHTLVPLGNISLLPNVEPEHMPHGSVPGLLVLRQTGSVSRARAASTEQQGLLPKSPPKHHFGITKCTHVLLRGRQNWSKSLEQQEDRVWKSLFIWKDLNTHTHTHEKSVKWQH